MMMVDYAPVYNDLGLEEKSARDIINEHFENEQVRA